VTANTAEDSPTAHRFQTVPRRVFQRLLPDRLAPERCVEGYYLQRTRSERVAERRLRRRQLTDDGNLEISGPDLRERLTGRRGAYSGVTDGGKPQYQLRRIAQRASLPPQQGFTRLNDRGPMALRTLACQDAPIGL
jgi:hypothetical protein